MFDRNKLLKKAEETEVLGKILQAENESLKDKLSYLNVDLRKVSNVTIHAVITCCLQCTEKNISNNFVFLRS